MSRKTNRKRRFFSMLRGILKRRKAKTFSSAGVCPVKGCILMCDLTVVLEHTGVYIGNGRIVSLNRRSQVSIEDKESFFPPWTDPKSNKIYTACYGDTDEVLASPLACKRAEKKVNLKTPYNVLFNNCHRFTTGCLTGDFENEVMSFAQLEEAIFNNLEALRPKKSVSRRFLAFVLRRKTPPQQQFFSWKPVVFQPYKKRFFRGFRL